MSRKLQGLAEDISRELQEGSQEAIQPLILIGLWMAMVLNTLIRELAETVTAHSQLLLTSTGQIFHLVYLAVARLASYFQSLNSKTMKYLAIFALLVLTGCPKVDDGPDSTITICNNAMFSITHKMSDITRVTNTYSDSVSLNRQTVLSNACKEYPDGYLEYFAKTSDTIPIYFFNTDTLKAYPWAVVRDNNKYLEKRILTRAYLDSVGWRIEFQ
jgi:hypothetical protein